jgi:hypothetical protein
VSAPSPLAGLHNPVGTHGTIGTGCGPQIALPKKLRER